MKALLVEDNPADARLIREMLKESPANGFEFQHVTRLDAALGRLRQETFDVVLLDLGLPDSHGMQTVTAIQTATSGLPVVVLTGRDDPDFALEVVRAGAQDYLVKGRFDGQLLLRSVHYAVERKRAEEEVRRLNAELEQRVVERTAALNVVARKFATMFDTNSDGVWIHNLQGQIVEVNDAYCRMCGYTRGELVQMPINQLEANETAEEVAEQVKKLLQRGGHDRFESRHRRKDGSIFDVDITVLYLDIDGGRIAIFVRDITERKRVEEALRRSEERLRVAALAAEIGVWYWSPGTNYIEVSANWRRLFGIAPDVPVTFATWRDALHQDDRERVVCELRAASSEHREFNAEYRVLHPDGAVRWVVDRGQASYDQDGRPVAMAGVNVDITERKWAEVERDRLAKQRQLALNAAQLGWWHYDPVTKIATFDERYQEIFQVSGHQCPVDELLARLHPDDQLGVWPRVEAALNPADPKPYSAEYRINVPDGSVRWVEAHGMAIFEGEGQDRRATSLVGTVEDITERKQAQAALIRSEKLASVGRMAATIAHEINNPLAAVMNTIFIARENADSPEQVREALEVADEELRRIAHLTRQTLGFYRESIAPANVSVNEVLDSAIDLLKSKIKTKRATIRKQYEAEIEIVGVAGELRQVFSNLIGNSLDAIEEGGTISLSVAPSVAESRGQCVTVAVTDNGKGIRADALPHIFEPFFTTKQEVGTGLGMWIAKQIVEKHGGSIRLQSSTDGTSRGTAISIVLPVNAEPASAKARRQRSETKAAAVGRRAS